MLCVNPTRRRRVLTLLSLHHTPRQSSVVDVVHPPSMGVGVVHPPYMGVDVTSPMPVGVHLPSMGAGVVGPMLAQVSRQSGVAYPPRPQLAAGVDVTSGIVKPTSADVGFQPGATAAAYQPPTWTGSKPAYTSQYAAMRTDVAVHTSAETLTAQSLLLFGRHAASPHS